MDELSQFLSEEEAEALEVSLRGRGRRVGPSRTWRRRGPARRWPWTGGPGVDDSAPEPVAPRESEHVRWVQSGLNQILGLRLPVDGLMGPATRSAIRVFQERTGLQPDGIVGPETERALVAARARPAARPGELAAFESEVIGEEWLESEINRSSQDYVRWIQEALNQVLGPRLKVDGILGPLTRAAIVTFQTSHNLAADGVVGPVTERGLILAGAPPPGPRSSQDYIRWAQNSLNRIMGLRLVVDGINGPLTRSAVRSFQQQQGLLVDGIVGPQTESRLRNAPCTCAGFFAEYDLRFEPMVALPTNRIMTAAERALRAADVNAAVTHLLSRRNARAAAALAGNVLTPPALPAALAAAMRRLSIAQLDLFRQCFADGAGGIVLPAFRSCFELFSNGELRTGVPGEREPNGGFYFLFAEFAFLCVDAGIDGAAWTPLLPTLVGTQELFMHIYRPAPAPPAPFPPAPSLSAPVPAPGPARRPLDGALGFNDANFNPVGRSSPARKTALRTKYAPLGPPALSVAARDNLLRALRMP